mmetsp:Transcript_12727/g.21588  ORF Transcript_12727/g.21588 Transcript_12727/m.21588 type:complete len:455 (-) Transcript_12727:22-1386(-)|eukprot:CAMPEP_0198206036 /NCGR_PEP_ID=MMETSP1445-20131203/9562_1 /TAXON_ID=36898 /ORGANISM="Pyramimonas sp., Strain CCMP2087" /LENGTH=454 /DNA_ID=CAMNT_0043878569 /DNA_START=51 /DNA_END=1415 /DNA_ORIENTATION=+
MAHPSLVSRCFLYGVFFSVLSHLVDAKGRTPPIVACEAGKIPAIYGESHCCPATCGVCGGPSCAKRPGGYSKCCQYGRPPGRMLSQKKPLSPKKKVPSPKKMQPVVAAAMQMAAEEAKPANTVHRAASILAPEGSTKLRSFSAEELSWMWRLSRDQLGLTSQNATQEDDEGNTETRAFLEPECDNHGKCVTQFYRSCPELLLGEKSNSVYIHVPEGANTDMVCKVIEHTSPAVSFTDVASNPGAKPLACSAESLATLTQAYNTLRFFTFVRDPIQHFLSGYVESEQRHMREGNVAAIAAYQSQFRNKVGTTARVKEYVTKILSEKYMNIRGVREVYRVYPQSGFAKLIPNIFFGRLENLNEDWRRLQRLLRVRQLPVDLSCADEHPDEFAATLHDVAQKAVFQDVQLHRALCVLFLPDYINFGYELPKNCKTAAIRAVLSKILAPPNVKAPDSS